MKKLQIHFFGLIFLLTTFFVNTSFSQNVNKPSIPGPGSLKVNSFSGGLSYEREDLSIPCRGISINLTFYYNSPATAIDYGFGSGWSMTYSMLYSRNASSITIRWGDGRKDIYSAVSGGYSPPAGIFDNLTEYQPNKFVLTTKHGIKYFFDDATHKRLTKISDPNNNNLTIAYAGSLATSITDPSGRSIQLNYTNGHLTDITDPNTNPASHITFVNDLVGNPTRVTDPMGNAINYEYNSSRSITKVTDKGSNQVTITYNNSQNVSKISSSLETIDVTYDVAQKKTTASEMVGGVLKSNSYSYDLSGNLKQSINQYPASCIYFLP